MNKYMSACFLIPAPVPGYHVSHWISDTMHLRRMGHGFIGFMFYCGGTVWGAGGTNKKKAQNLNQSEKGSQVTDQLEILHVTSIVGIPPLRDRLTVLLELFTRVNNAACHTSLAAFEGLLCRVFVF